MSCGSQTITRRTYGSRSARARTNPSIVDTASEPVRDSLQGNATPISTRRESGTQVAPVSTLSQKRPLADLRSFFETDRSTKRTKSTAHRKTTGLSTSSDSEAPPTVQTLTQLHFISSKPTLVTCKLCDLSYTRGAPEDEELHRTHCSRIVRGMEWSREERTLEKPLGSEVSDVELVEERCVLPNGTVGRIVRIRCDVTKGKLGQKVTILLSTVNRALSAPPLPESDIKSAKAYVMIVPAPPPKRLASGPKAKLSPRHLPSERIVGCVITSRITHAMRVLATPELQSSNVSKSDLVCVDIDDSRGNVYCDPTPIPATLGIPRLFVVPSHRRQGIAQTLLDAAARTAIWGCPLDPASGQIAFSQPTASGRAVMKSWGGEYIRIYNEQ
ncbi:hypothetical protein BDV93DRAFT_543963 [Ceratobasidium sp. AG-I]|nr:hypothetical protein BDV93DRAFT_543963 [Ceratobasidium sp. AG-I]